MEIESRKSESIYIISKDLKVGLDEVISIFLRKGIREKILLQLRKFGLDKEERIIALRLAWLDTPCQCPYCSAHINFVLL